MAQTERENFYRNSTVIVDHGKESLSAVLENDLTNTKLTFEDFINRHQHDIYHLCYNKSSCCQCPTGRFVPANKSRILYPGQLDLLLDTSGSTLNGHNPNTSRTSQHCCRPAKRSLSTLNLDITLLRCLLMNFAINCRTNFILRQDIEDLVKCRNTLYGHAQEARLSDSDYAKYKTDVEGIILRIARFCNIENEMRQKLNDASMRPLDETILKQYQISLLQQSLLEKNIDERVNELQQHLSAQDERLDCSIRMIDGKFSEFANGRKNIIAQTEARLLEHSKDDTYVITKDVELCCDVLDTYKTLVIIAKAGGGKTKTSLQIATMYLEMYKPMLFVNDEVVRKRDLINFNESNIIIVEDLFGRSNIEFNEDLHRGILDVLHSSLKSESCKSKLIFTIRGNAEMNLKLNEWHRIFEKDILINLDENRSVNSNELIFTKHMNKHGITLCANKHLTNICSLFSDIDMKQQCKSDGVKTNTGSLEICVSTFNKICSGQYEMHIGFPQACHLFCSNINFTKQGIEYFTHASQSLVDEIEKFKTQGFDDRQMQYQYCTLVYTAIKGSIIVDDIDENCFKNILSYFDSKTIRISLLKEAVRKLEGTYINKSSPELACNNAKRQKVSDIYVLQHNTIQEAILLSYGEDADVLSICDSKFLFKYIRPKDYELSPSDNMVYLFTDYKLIAKKLISLLSTGEYTCIFVGVYLKTIALMQRHDEIIQCFFDLVQDFKSEQFVCLLNGLTCIGKNEDLVKFHPQLCKNLINNGGWVVFLASSRPIGWADTTFFEIETDVLIEKLMFIMALNRFNKNDLKSDYNERQYRPFPAKMVNYQFALGNYVFENLIAKDFLDIAETLFTNIKQKEQDISPIHIKEFLDGLLDEGKRSCVVSQFKEFFEAVIFKYGSISIILQLCRPLTGNISNPNIIQVDDILLTGKLSAYLESSFEEKSYMEKTEIRGNGAYFVHKDYDYLLMKNINDIAKFIAEHGVKVNNDKFVRTMFDTLVTDMDRIENTIGLRIFDSENGCYDEQYEVECDEDGSIATKIVLDDYPDEELGVDENGCVVYQKFKKVYVRRAYHDFRIFCGPTYPRLLQFLWKLNVYWIFCDEDYKYKRMIILKYKFKNLLNIARRVTVDECRRFDSDESYSSDSSE